MSTKDERPIIIIKKVKKVEGGHHGGAWKVAYADFVTAMMAFFLLLWLLNVTTDEQKLGIAQYFDPISISRSVSGSGGVLGGKSMVKDGAMVSPTQPMGVDMNMPGVPEAGPNSEKSAHSDQYGDGDLSIEDASDLKKEKPISDKMLNKKVSQEQFEKLKAEQEQKEFDKAAEQIRQAIQDTPDLAELAPHIIVDNTPEGLRIQVIDQEGRSMFPSGSSRMYDETNKLFQLIEKVISKLPNKISITGHTDSTPYRDGAAYDNWELSADRANSSRRALTNAGFDASRISHVVGKADKEHLITDDPNSPRNRRISIILLRERPLTPAAETTPSSIPATATPSQQQGVKPVDALEYQRQRGQ